MRRLFLTTILIWTSIIPASGKTLSENWRELRSSWLSAEMRFVCGGSQYKLGKSFRGSLKLDWLNAEGNWQEMKLVETANEAIKFEGLGKVASTFTHFTGEAKNKHIIKVLEFIEKPNRNIVIANDVVFEFSNKIDKSTQDSIFRQLIKPESLIVTLVARDFPTPERAILNKLRAEATQRFLWKVEPIDPKQFIPFRYMINFTTAAQSGEPLAAVPIKVTFDGEPRPVLPESFVMAGRDLASANCKGPGT